MPPWGALDTPECTPPRPWKADLRLSDQEIATLNAWHEAGAPMGDPNDAPEGLTPAQTYFELADADKELTPLAPFVAGGDDGDTFRCFVLDLDATQDLFLNAVQVVPGNPQVVHHAVLFVDAEGTSSTLAGPDGGFDCFGGSGVTSAATLDVWVPGSPPREFPPNVGTRLPAGSKLVMQIHYHAVGGAAAPDLTKVQIRFNPVPPELELFTVLFGNASEAPQLLPGPNDENGVEFRIPAGAKNHTEAMKFTTSIDDGNEIALYGVFTHMHYVGRDMAVVVEHADGTAECLLRTPQWDFNWQRFYAYDAPLQDLPTLRYGDTIGLGCMYDNSMENPFVQRALKEQGLIAPVDVRLGEETLDEMCVAGFQVVLPRLP
jgi:hypothetical protein